MDRTAAFADAVPALVLARRPRGPGAGRAPGRPAAGPTSWWSVAATPACGPPCWPSRTTRRVTSSSLEGDRCGWAASGRNGGFCAASLTHGLANGVERFPDEVGTLERLGRENLDAIEATVAAEGIDCDFERTGELDVATEPHQVAWLREAEALAHGHGGHPVFLDARRAAGRGPLPDLPGRPVGAGQLRAGQSGPAGLGAAGGLRAGRGAHPRAHPGRGPGPRRAGPGAADGRPHRPTARSPRPGWCWPPTPRPSPVRRLRKYIVPVYDYVLMTEPLTRGPDRRRSAGSGARASAPRATSSSTTGARPTTGSCSAATTPSTTTATRWGRPSSSDRPPSPCCPPCSPRRSRCSRTSASPTPGPAPSTPAPGSAPSSTARSTGGWPRRPATPASGWGPPASAPGSPSTCCPGADTELTRLGFVRTKPIPFPPSRCASIGINLTRWSLARADAHQGRRNLWLRALDAVGLGFDS